MFNCALVVTSVLTAALTVAAMPLNQSNAFARGIEIPPTVEVCTGNVGTGCVTIPIVSDDCVNFTGGLSFLNDEVSSAVIPGGFVCTFGRNFGCDSSEGDAVFLQGGTWNFQNVPGTSGNVNFNDAASSFVCSPV